MPTTGGAGDEKTQRGYILDSRWEDIDPFVADGRACRHVIHPPTPAYFHLHHVSGDHLALGLIFLDYHSIDKHAISQFDGQQVRLRRNRDNSEGYS
jgi:hypothetical protein